MFKVQGQHALTTIMNLLKILFLIKIIFNLMYFMNMNKEEEEMEELGSFDIIVNHLILTYTHDLTSVSNVTERETTDRHDR